MLRGVSLRDAGNFSTKFQLSTACSARLRKNCAVPFFGKSFMRRTKKRTTRAYVWLTPEEKNAWKNLAASSGMNLNDYIRSCVERRKIPSVSA
jgi:hypothetical protein